MLDFDITKDNVRDNIASGNINPRILKQLFADMQIRSYAYDYQIQKELVNYHEERITVKDLKQDVGVNLFTDGVSERVYYFPMKHQLIATGKRKAWRDSAVYNKALTFDELNENHKLFRFNVLVFVNEQLYTNVRIKAKEEFTHIYFRYRDLSKMVQTTGVNITILCIPQSVVTVVDNIDATLYNKGHFSFRLFNPTSLYELYQCESYFAFLINKETNRYIMSDEMEYLGDEEMFHFRHDHLPSDIIKYKLVVIGSDLLYSISDLPADNDQFFATELENMPIPKDNISILVKNSDGLWKPNPGSVVLTEKYPNVFQVTNPEDYQLRLIVYYADDTQNDHIVYDTEMDYYLNNVNLLDAYQNGYVPTLLKDFAPMQWDYALKDYFQKNNGIHDANIKEPWTSFSYKLKTISNIIKQWSSFYLEYAKRTYGFLTGWYHDISKWSPERLASKERMSSLEDIPLDPTGREQYPTAYFKEPQYVFTYKNTNTYDDPTSYLFYIDGKMVIPTSVLVFRGYQYVYLPKKRITSTSMIEVERFDGVRFSKRLRVPEEGVLIDLSLLRGNLIANSLFIVNEAQEFANKNYKVEVIDPELGTYVLDLDTSVYNLLPSMTLKITPLFPQYNDSLISLNCNNQLITFNRRNSGDDYSTGKPVNFNPNGPIMNVKKMVTPRLRMYTKDGRFLSKLSYVVHKRENAKSKPKFSLPVRPGETREMMIAYVGYDERLIYHLDEIPNNGLIDVEGKTNRPICLSYHDIYLNGIKLHKNDIMIISPFKFVITTLETHNTLSNLEIYEKAYADDNLFKFEIDEDSLYLADRLFNEDDKFRNELIESLDTIDPDGSVEDIQFIRDWYSELLNKWLFNNQLNADTRHDLEFFAPLFDKDFGYRLLFNADDRVRYKVKEENRFYLWHDGSIRENDGNNPVHESGRFSDLEGNVPNPELHMTEKEFLAKGSAPIDGNTVLDYHTELHKEPKAPQYHFPSDLDNKPNLSNLNTSADVVTITEESYSEVERTRIGTHQPVHKVSTTEVDPKPADVVIEPIEPEHVRMPSRIATPEPTLPEEGEYERVEETLTTQISYGLEGIELPGLQLEVYNGRHKKQIPFKSTVGSTENATVRLRYTGTVPENEEGIITIFVMDEDKRVIYTYEMEPAEHVEIDQEFTLFTKKFNLFVKYERVYDDSNATLAFGEVDSRYTNQLVAIDAKSNEIVYRFGRPVGGQQFTILENRKYYIALDYKPNLAAEYDRVNQLADGDLSYQFFLNRENHIRNYHMVFVNGELITSFDSNDLDEITDVYREDTAYRRILTNIISPNDSTIIDIKTIRITTSGNTQLVNLVPAKTIDLSNIRQSSVSYRTCSGKLIQNHFTSKNENDFMFDAEHGTSSTDIYQQIISSDNIAKLLENKLNNPIHIGDNLYFPMNMNPISIEVEVSMGMFDRNIANELPLANKLIRANVDLLNADNTVISSNTGTIYQEGINARVMVNVITSDTMSSISKLSMVAQYDASDSNTLIIENGLTEAIDITMTLYNGVVQTISTRVEPIQTKTVTLGRSWIVQKIQTIETSAQQFSIFVNNETTRVKQSDLVYKSDIHKIHFHSDIVRPKTSIYTIDTSRIDSFLSGQIKISDGVTTEDIIKTTGGRFTFASYPERNVSIFYQFDPMAAKKSNIELSVPDYTISQNNAFVRLSTFSDIKNSISISVDGASKEIVLDDYPDSSYNTINDIITKTDIGHKVILAENIAVGEHVIDSLSIYSSVNHKSVAASGHNSVDIGSLLDKILNTSIDDASITFIVDYPSSTSIRKTVTCHDLKTVRFENPVIRDKNHMHIYGNHLLFPSNASGLSIAFNILTNTNDESLVSEETYLNLDSVNGYASLYLSGNVINPRTPEAEIVNNEVSFTIPVEDVNVVNKIDIELYNTQKKIKTIRIINNTKNIIEIASYKLRNSHINKTISKNSQYITHRGNASRFVFNGKAESFVLSDGWECLAIDINTSKGIKSCSVNGESIPVSEHMRIEKDNIEIIEFS